jgi:bifunctional DNA-binding transcriptional regulator/antitoxin component of YhaV-PrlF toxin-antitoxin module
VVLTERVCFKTVFQKGNRVQVPKLVRWRFKLDSKQMLEVTLKVVGSFKGHQSFYCRMGKDGRINVPAIQRELLKHENEDSLDHHIIDVTLEPA